jgi:hypothetical protein
LTKTQNPLKIALLSAGFESLNGRWHGSQQPVRVAAKAPPTPPGKKRILWAAVCAEVPPMVSVPPPLPAVPSELRGGVEVSLPAADLAAMKAELAAEQELRELLVPRAQQATTKALHTLQALHCGDTASARSALAECATAVAALLTEVQSSGPRPWYQQLHTVGIP